MRKTNKVDNTEFLLAVDIDTLALMLGCGKTSAKKIGEEAEARINIGRRVLYSISKIERYIELIAS